MSPPSTPPPGGPSSRSRVREKELRIALVCYGGVSLAIYQHGITKEILKLVRASRSYHAAAGQAEKQRPDHAYRPTRPDGAGPSTEAVYFECLKAIGGQGLDLRVIVDVIAGASSGGINGIVLARALAHDLAMEPATDVWLRDVDIANLLAPEARAEPWHKWYVRPFLRPILWEVRRKRLLQSEIDRETRDKLSLFLRSRWFEPPLDGPRLSALLLDAMERMGEPPSPSASLVPAGQRLDLGVTVTDYYGAERLIHLHDPPVVREREHRHALRFSFEHRQTGGMQSDFGFDNVPSLAFAARATSSYPGAFPPVQVREMDALLAGRGRSWSGREAFLDANFAHYRQRGLSPEDAVLLDGSVLNNKPFELAIDSIRSHVAFREVDRRLVYIDPNPRKHGPLSPGPVPGFFSTLRGALSDLPRYDPINDELAWIARLNEEARRERAAIEAIRPDVAARVEQISGDRLTQPVTAERLQAWRIEAGRVLMQDTRLTYNQYVRLMIGEAIGYLSRLVGAACGEAQDSARAWWITRVLEAWAQRRNFYLSDYEIPREATSESALPPAIAFMIGLNLDYRYRRLYFVIHTINRFYPRLLDPAFCGVTPDTLDVFKRAVYGCLESLHAREEPSFLTDDCLRDIRALFSGLATGEGDALPDAERFVAGHGAALDRLVDEVSRQCDFSRFNEEADAVLSSPAFHALGPACRRGLLIAYIGFVFWDIVILPMIRSQAQHKLGELGEIVVDRISPEDAKTLRTGGAAERLKGVEFRGFGAFFSQAAREHDYLWGRLDAVERLFDLLASASAGAGGSAPDMRSFRKQAFEAVLREESARLQRVPELLAKLARAVEEL